MVHAWKSARIIGAIAIELFIYVSEQETMVSEIAQTDNFNDKTNIKVVGVGGAGGNAVNRMIAEGLQSVEFIAINTDAKDLLRSDADVKISLNDASSRGLGAGADPEKGAKAAQDHQSDIEEALKGSDMVFVTCGEGGGTGTGASPIVARAAHQQGALTIAVVTRPFSFEGPQRSASAALGIENLRKEMEAKLGKSVNLNIVEVRSPDLNAQLVAENIAQQLEKRISFRRAMKKAMQHMLEEGKNLGANMRFVELMLPHHAMALEMSVPALLGSNNPQILNLAENIIISQAKEMRQFKAWIAEHHKK